MKGKSEFGIRNSERRRGEERGIKNEEVGGGKASALKSTKTTPTEQWDFFLQRCSCRQKFGRGCSLFCVGGKNRKIV